MILSIPWLIVAIILYNVIAFSASWPPAGGQTVFDDRLFSLDMISGATWTLTVGDLVTIITLVLLFVEIIKATRTGGSSIVDHGLSTVLFMFCLVEFLVVRQAATSVFFFILTVALIDVIAGFSITIRGARRDFGFGGAQGE
ncbi:MULTISPECIES: hypothetical protein [Rhodomicrobium]|uniref:hypothetical protein n=1 Tax=Rhodomicrobium TaxID=1068 RepID=UPI000B4AAC98|nr:MULTISPECIES: hypothetical protein [Rhodomicrobium]